MKKPASHFKAFTLIELLVVISIVSLLISILLPALASARGAARTSQCISNIKAQALAIHMYASEFKEYTPPYIIRRASGTWPGPAGYPSYYDAYVSDHILLGRYTSSDKLDNGSQTMFGYIRPKGIWNCPDYPLNMTYNNQTQYQLSTLTYARVEASKQWTQMWRMADAIRPSTLLALADSSAGGYHPGYSGQFYMITDNDALTVGTNSIGTVLYGNNLRVRHNQRTTANISFLDGHAGNFMNPNDEYLAGKISITNPKL